MDKNELLNQIDKILNDFKENLAGTSTQALEFLRIYGGKNNEFYRVPNDILNRGSSEEHRKDIIINQLYGFRNYIEKGLLKTVSFEREIQIDTVSDYLSQAEDLLIDKKVHPAAPAVLIGASLEEFLRNWLEELEHDMAEIKLSLDAYTKELRNRELLTKQDVKDITSWAGTRNDAAHGNWDEVKDKNRIRLMLEGVNLFMRKYGKN